MAPAVDAQYPNYLEGSQASPTIDITHVVSSS
jgi:hypothetical protein